jgi:cation diffusion facilitator family transporter
MIVHAGHHDHLEAGRRITWIGIAVNAALIALKLFGGFVGRSRALLADAVHSLSDLVTDFVVLVGLHFLGKKEDAEHPYGHGKIETLATLGVGSILLAAAVKIGYDAATAVSSGELSAPHRYTIAIAAFSIVAKEMLYQATVRIGRRAGSEAMVANAWHHRSDAWSSVVTLIGVGLASFVPRLRVLDSYAALLVSFFIIKVAVEILGGAVRKIIDTAPSGRFIEEVCETAESVDGVIECHDVMARYYGPVIRMELHIVVDPQMTVLQAHGIIDKVVAGVMARYSEVGKILVHVDPRRKAEETDGDIEGSGI